MPRSPSCWLGAICHNNEVSLVESARLDNLTREFSSRKAPLVVTLAGFKSPSILTLLGLPKELSISQPSLEVHLGAIEIETPDEDHTPVLVASAPLFATKRFSTRFIKSKKVLRRQAPYLGAPSVLQAIYKHALLPFSDLFYYFVESHNALEKTASCLAEIFSNEPRDKTGPRLILVVPSTVEHSSANWRDELFTLYRRHSGSELLCAVQDVECLIMAEDPAPKSKRTFRASLLQGLWTARQHRYQHKRMFSAQHLTALLHYACDHVSQGSSQPFDAISAARRLYPVAKDLGEHIFRFLGHFQDSEELVSTGMPVLASSLLLDSFPPGSHFFDPKEVFLSSYKSVFSSSSSNSQRSVAFAKSSDVLLRSGLLSLAQKSFVQAFKKMLESHQTAAQHHVDTLTRFRTRISKLSGNATCLVCLQRQPQYKLSCSHFVCENCIKVFARRDSCRDSVFTLEHCLLCGVSSPKSLSFTIHPPTIGASVLSIDGGGTRGIVPLTVLQRLEEEIGLPIPLQRFFKVAFGVSTGALIISAMFLNGWDTKTCIEQFEQLSKVAFLRRNVTSIPLLCRLQNIITCWLHDSLYPETHIEEALQATFGDTAITDSTYATTSGVKVGLLASSINEEAIVFNNYNGVGQRDASQEYHVVCPKDTQTDVKIWEASASAAATFFPLKEIPMVGTFQDVGPLVNDPTLTATAEAMVFFPHTRQPDFILSLGTGVGQSHVRCNPSFSASVRNDRNRSIWRVLRMVWKRTSDRSIKQALQSNSRYHRIDVEFEGEEPRLDDVASIPELKYRVRTDASLQPNIEHVARSAVASLFYLELAEEFSPYQGHTSYRIGHVRCSLPPGDPALGPLLEKLVINKAVFHLNDTRLFAVRNDGSSFASGFGQQIKLPVVGEFAVTVKFSHCEPCHISGSPFTCKRLAETQQLYAPFGRSDHVIPKKRSLEVSADVGAVRKRRRISNNRLN